MAELTGAGVAKVHALDVNGKLAVASEWVDNPQPLNFGDPAHRAKMQEDFATHAWLANWDVAGLAKENTVLANGKAVCIDMGGSMKYRAQGAPKGDKWGETVPEFDVMRKEGNLDNVYAEMTPQQLVDSLKKVTSITNKQIDEMVAKFGPGNGPEKMELAMQLQKRRDYLTERQAVLEAGLQTPKPIAEKPKLTEAPKPIAEKPKPAESTEPTSAPINLPAKPISATIANKWFAPKIDQLEAAAKTGKWENVAAIPTSSSSNNTYSKKSHAYKLQLLQALGAPKDWSNTPEFEDVVTPPKTPKAPKAPTLQQQATQTAEAKLPKAAPKINPSEFPPEPEFVSKNAANVAQNKALVEKIKKLAIAGDVAGLQGLASTLPASQKLNDYHKDILSNVSEQLNPPPPPKSISISTLAALKNATFAEIGPGLERIGHWAVVGKVEGLTEDDMPTGKWQPMGKSSSTDNLMSVGATRYSKLPEEQKSALSSYTGDGYGSINNSLRNPPPSNLAKSAVNGFHGAKTAIPQGMTIGRGYDVASSMLANHVKKLQASVGCVIAEPALLSTTTGPDVGIYKHKRVNFIMTTGPGVKGLPAAKFSKVGSHEQEIILGPGQRIMIHKVEVNGDLGNLGSGTIKVYGTLLPSD